MLSEISETSVLELIVDKGPMWVIASMVILAVAYVGRLAVVSWLPDIVEAGRIGFKKHCLMLDTATEGIAKSTEVIAKISDQIHINSDLLKVGHRAIAEAAEHACNALLLVSPEEVRPQVEVHLKEIVRILENATR